MSALRDTADQFIAASRQVGRGRLVLLGVVFLVLAAALPLVVTISLGDAPYRLLFTGYPGVDVAVVTTVLTVVANGGMVVSAGALIHLLFLDDRGSKVARVVKQGLDLSILRVASAAWGLGAAGLVVFESLDANGTPLSRLATPGALGFLFEASTAPRAWAVSFAASLIVFFAGWFATRWTSFVIPLAVTAIALLAPVVTGQVLVGPDHDFGGDAAVVSTIAASAYFGVVLVAAIRVALGRQVSWVQARRIGLIGLPAMAAVLAAETVIAVFKLAGSGLFESLTGWLIFVNGLWMLLAAVSAVVVWRRSRRSAPVGAGAVILAVLPIAGWIGLQVAMTRQPPPQYFVETSITQVFMGFDVNEAPTFVVLLTQWRPNLLFLVISLCAIGVYLFAVRVLRRRGDAWPAGRTVAWILGWSVVIFATSSGFGKYSAPDFGVHMIVHMALGMLAPILLVMGGIVTLLLRATRSNPTTPATLHNWLLWTTHWRLLRVLSHPVFVFVLFVGSYYALYLTGAFEVLMRFHWAHQLMNLHFLITGYLFYWLVVGVDRPPRPLPHVGKLGFVLAAMPFHAFFGIILMTSTTIIAENFYNYLDLPWADLPAQQYLAGGVAWGGGELPLIIVIIVLVTQWAREDARIARRTDRHLDSERDVEYDAYNQMLERLAARANNDPRTKRDSG